MSDFIGVMEEVSGKVQKVSTHIALQSQQRKEDREGGSALHRRDGGKGMESSEGEHVHSARQFVSSAQEIRIGKRCQTSSVCWREFQGKGCELTAVAWLLRMVQLLNVAVPPPLTKTPPPCDAKT